ncbi:MAG: hypothetical protein K1X88_28210 [Nannocystaceae bacterium]|nr:hypothetical protein [Nannocystaceae bacterium]
MLVTRRCVALLVLAASASCDRTPTPAAAPANATAGDAAPAADAAPEHGPTARANPPPAASPQPAAVAPSVAAAAIAPRVDAAAVTKSKAPRAADAPRFTRAARMRDDSGSTLQTRFARTVDGKRFVIAGAAVLSLGDDGSVGFDPESLRGIDDVGFDLEGVSVGMVWWYAIAMGGASAEGTFLTLGMGSGSRGGDDVPRVYKRTGGVWSRLATRKPSFDWYYAEYGPWKDGSLLGLERYQIRGPGSEDGPSAAQQRAFAAAVAKQKPLVVVRGAPKAPLLGSGTIETFASLPSGEIFAYVRHDESNELVVWNDATGTLQRTPVPGMDPVAPRLLAVAPDQAWLLGEQSGEAREGGGLLVRWDGHGWTQLATPCNSQITAMAVAGDGHAYLTCGVDSDVRVGSSALLRLSDGEQPAPTFEEVPLPTESGEGPVDVLAGADDTLWVLTGGDPLNANALWRTGAAATEVEIPSTKQTLRAVLEWAPPRPLDATCEHPWVPLPPGTDRVAAEAAVVAALAELDASSFGAELLEARVQGRVELGVHLPMGGGKGVRQRVAAIGKALAGKVGEATCNERPPAQEPPDEPVP